ncbi:unnamed protein product [Polarella glacialis]|uniref:C3H1-type domain-containing protein n=1 Tax=Polarella glacialis TaxID=89957 RepID=A0A813FP79_POLGL|nr:unnamed protein product [Polarella glacialis]
MAKRKGSWSFNPQLDKRGRKGSFVSGKVQLQEHCPAPPRTPPPRHILLAYHGDGLSVQFSNPAIGGTFVAPTAKRAAAKPKPLPVQEDQASVEPGEGETGYGATARMNPWDLLSNDRGVESKDTAVLFEEEEGVDDEAAQERHGKPQSLPACVAALRKLPIETRVFPDCVSYCSKWLVKGKCSSSNKCSYLHSEVLMAKQNKPTFKFSIADSFKAGCNKVIAQLSAGLPERRAFVLDGAAGHTAKALGRGRHEVLSPNADFSSARALSKSSMSAHCTASAALELAAQHRLKFGAVYLDYMWPLDFFEQRDGELKSAAQVLPGAGSRASAIRRTLSADLPQLDGFRDIERVFGHSAAGEPVLCPRGAVLAITLSRPGLDEQKERLHQLLEQEGRRLDMLVQAVGEKSMPQRGMTACFFMRGTSWSGPPPAFLRGSSMQILYSPQ